MDGFVGWLNYGGKRRQALRIKKFLKGNRIMRKQNDDDDGRTIADMSDLQPGLSGFGRRSGRAFFSTGNQKSGDPLSAASGGDGGPSQGMPRRKRNPWEEDDTLTRKERRYYALGALKAGLLIALAYIMGLGALVGLLVLAWR